MDTTSPFAAAERPADGLKAQALPYALLQALPLGVCLVDSTGDIVTLNAAGARLLGWSEAACHGMAFHDLVGCWCPASATAPAHCPTATVLETNRPVCLPTTTLQCRNGTVLPVEYTCMPLSAHTGTSVVVSFRDLRPQQHLEQDLQRLASVPEESPLPIVELDAETRLTYANAAMLLLLEQCGFNAQALPAILPTDTRTIVHECLRSGHSRQGIESTAAARHFTWTFCPVIPAGIVRGYGMELTERKQAEQVLQASRDALLEAWRLKSEFVANVSHELRTPLNGILGMTQLVLDTPLEPEQRSDLLIVQESAEQLRRLVNALLDFAALETGTLVLARQPFSLPALLDALLPALRQQAQQKGLSLRLELPPHVPDTLQGDKARLQQILLNVVQNAIKFTTSGTITLQIALESCTPQDVVLHWQVQDTGIGLQAHQQQAIFEAFRQGDGSSTRLFDGVGLGLTIAAHLVTMMGGEIWVESAGPGQGSVFHFTTAFGVPNTLVLQSCPGKPAQQAAVARLPAPS